MSHLQYLIICITFLICAGLAQNTSCNALSSYVRVTSSSSIYYNRTILSAQALFEPYNYYVNPTELVTLTEDIDDICSGNLATDVRNKIVLIVPANGNCSAVKRVYGAEINGAKAVLIASDDVQTGSVEPIIDSKLTDDDGTPIVTTIPTRMIPSNDADILSLEIELDANPSRENFTLTVEFGCLESDDIDQILCIVDKSGDHWWLDGDYQLQVGIKKTGHSVWVKSGYLLVIDIDHYLFLHDGDGESEWYWAITEDPSMEDDDYIVAKCSEGLIENPMDCPSWKTTDFYLNGELTFSDNDNIMINNSLCQITDNRICIKSSVSTLAGLYGTYVQYNSQTPYWFREYSECDTQSGWLVFFNDETEGRFVLYEPFDFWIVADCIVSGYSYEERENTIAFRPDLCTEWNTLVDGSLDPDHKIYDPTMTITSDECSSNLDCPQDFQVPETMCMSRNSIMHSFLEGEYSKTGITGNKFNTSEWTRSDLLYYGDGSYVPVYVWYYGEVSDTLHWWVIANNNLSTAMANNGSSVYGFCPSYTNSPTNCLSCWNFYFSGDEDIDGAWHADCKFDLIADSCDTDTDPSITFNWPEYLCIRENTSDSYTGSIDWDLLKGGYEMNDTLTKFSGVPYWIKPPNTYNEDYTYIYYDKFYGYWQIGDELHVESTLICSQGEDDYLPTECKVWYDTSSKHVGNEFIYSGINCDASDVLRIKSEDENSSNTTVVAVLVILAIIACCIAGFFYLKHYQKQQRQKRGPFTATKVSTTGGFGSGDDMEMGDVDQMGLVNDGHTQTGGMDMSPLNVEGNNTKYDDDDDITVDAQQNAIDDDDDDDDDDEEQLIGGNGDTNRGDDLRLPSDNDDQDPDIEDADKQYTTSIMDE